MSTFSPPPPQALHPTVGKPLILITKNHRNQLAAKKLWREQSFGENINYYRERIWYSTAKVTKAGIETNEIIEWTKPKTATPEFGTVALILYSAPLNLCTTPFVLSLAKTRGKQNFPQPLEEYEAFIFEPTHHFSTTQAKALYHQLEGWVPPEKLNTFLSTYPTANKHLPDSPSAIPSFSESQTYPSTVQEAYASLLALHPNEAHHASHPNDAVHEPPTLLPVPQPAFPIQPYVMPNLRATNFRSGRTVPLGTYSVSLHVTKEGPHNARREVFYANDIPISPLKSTVAILYADTNPKSHTFNQPVIKSICIPKSTRADMDAFLAEHGPYLSAEQLAQFRPTTTIAQSTPTQPAEPSHHVAQTNQPNQGTTTMTIAHCAYCGDPFTPVRITSKFCSEQCRTIHHSHGRRKTQPTERQPQHPTDPLNVAVPSPAAVSREEFLALSARMDQIFNLLTQKV